MNFTDKAGVPVKPGDLVIYGHALGRCAGLQYGKVLALVPHPKSAYSTTTGDRDCKLRIIGVDDSWSYKELALLTKASVISFGDRVLKLHPDQVPENIASLLAGYVAKS